MAASGVAPERFTIVSGDYPVGYAGTAEDGGRFFLSGELFDLGSRGKPGSEYVGLFLGNADGTFSELRVDRIPEPLRAQPLYRGRKGSRRARQRAPVGCDT